MTKRFLPFIFASLLTLCVFWQFFAKGYVPMPASFMAAWYEPWKSDTAIGGVPTLPHKALGDDIFRQIVPFKILAADLFRSGVWPLWNPYGGSGQPLLANLHPGYLNPFSMLLWLNDSLGWSWFVIVQLPLLFLATYWYSRTIGMSEVSALTASLVLVLSGFATTRFIYGDYIYALSMLPILLVCIELIRCRKWLMPLIVVPIATAFLLVCVQPQISVYILCTVAIYAFVRLWKHVHMRSVVSAIFLFLLGCAIASVQILPTLSLLKQANVTTGSSAFIFSKFLMPLSHVVTMLIPNYFGNPGTYNFWGKTDFVETVASLGLIPVFLATIALIFPKKDTQLVRLFWIGSLISIVMTLDWSVPRSIFGLPLPILSTSIPTRLYMLSTFFMAMLAGWGIEILRAFQKKQNSQFLWCIGVYGLLVASFFGYTVYANRVHMICHAAVGIDCWRVAIRNSAIEVAVFGLFAVCVVLKKQLGIYVAIGCIALVGVYNSAKIIPMSPSEYFMQSHAILEYLQSLHTRVHSLGGATLATDLSTYYTFYDPNYYDPLYIKRYGELVSYANTNDKNHALSRSDVEINREVSTSNDATLRRNRLYELLSIGAIVYPKIDEPKGSIVGWSDDHRVVVMNSDALPRAYFVSSYDVVSDGSVLLHRLYESGFNPKTTVLLEEVPAGFVPSNIHVFSSTDASVTQDHANTIDIAVHAKHDGLLVLTDTYDPGWKAIVDGKESKIYRANYAFRAVVVSKGEHIIRFVYDPPSFVWGLRISVVSFVIWILLVGVGCGKIQSYGRRKQSRG